MRNVIGIDPTVDFAFKLLLGSPEHSRVTIHFLNAILGNGPKITQVVFQNPFVEKKFDEDKLSILDIRAIDEHGRHLNIEMQTSLPVGLCQRLAYYDALLYVDQMREGRPYHELRPAIVICVLSVPLFPAQAHLHTDFRLRDQSGIVLTDDLQVHTLELTKLEMTRDNLINATPIESWAYFLRHAPEMTVEEVRRLFPEPEFAEAAGVLEMISQTPEQLHEYAARMKLRLDDAARIQYARQEGHQEGEQKGRLEGEQRGKLLGSIATLQELLSVTTPSADELSGYDLEQLSAVREQLQQQVRNRN